MFERLFGESKEETQWKKQQLEERQFIRERDSVNNSMQDDNAYMQLREERIDLTRWQQDLDDSIELLKHDLMNEELTEAGFKPRQEFFGYDENGNAQYRPIKPLMNGTGIYLMITTVRRYLNRNVMMSNLSEEIILRILKRLKITLVINLGANYKEYEIDATNLPLIVKLIMDSVEATLYRSLENGERRYLNTINKRVETYNASPQQQKKSVLGVLG